MGDAKRLKIEDEPEMEGLNELQRYAFRKVINGESLFITGSGGVGKSELIKRLTLWHQRSMFRIGVTATTGIAAVAIDGRTLHSFARMTPDDDHADPEDIVKRNVLKDKRYRDDAKKLRALLIDESSMLSPDLFEKLNFIYKALRQDGRPFGGLQMILVGDFFQLPPVSKDGPKKFLFESPVFWDTIGANIVELTQVMRQSDPVFIGMLQRMRIGKMTEEDFKLLETRVRADVTQFGVQPTTLYARNMDVDRINREHLMQLPAPMAVFKRRSGAYSTPGTSCDQAKRKMVLEMFLKNVAEKVEIKLDAQVMLSYNLDTEGGLVNGSRGVVIGFETPAEPDLASYFEQRKPEEPLCYPAEPMPKVRFIVGHAKGPDGKDVALTKTIIVPYVMWRKKDPASKVESYAWQVPLKLAWATTIHKSQGLTMNCVEVTLDNSVFEEGQAYVAVSRVRSIEGLTLRAFERQVIRANAKVVEFATCSPSVLRGKYLAEPAA